MKLKPGTAVFALGAFGLCLASAGLAAPGDVRPSPPPVTTVPTAPAPAPAVPQGAKISLSADGQTVFVVGMIMEGTFFDFEEALRRAPQARTVHLSSNGGLTIEARLMAALVRKRGLNTYVEFYCASACTQVFVAGRERVIGPAAQLGFHQAVLLDPKVSPAGTRARTDRKLTSTTVFGVNGNDTLRLAYELGGVDPAFVDKALGYGHDSMWLPATGELLAAHVITRQAAVSELPIPPGGSSREQVRARLLEQPLWQAGLTRLPDLGEAAIDDVWRALNSGASMAEATEVGRSKLVVAGTRLMGLATDDLLGQSIALYAASARDQRVRGYPGCKTGTGLAAAPVDPAAAEFERQEDALMVALFTSTERIKPMDGAEATRFFTRDVVPQLVGTFKEAAAGGTEGKCRLGFRIFETIGDLPAKKRIRAYRALLSLPGMAAL